MRSARRFGKGLEMGLPSTYVRRDKLNSGPGDAQTPRGLAPK
jgi:hypothetical protein